MEIKHLNAKGEVKYYSTYRTAWSACIRLNESETRGTWVFEADLNGWFLYLDQD